MGFHEVGFLTAFDFVLADPDQVEGFSFEVLVAPKGVGAVGDESDPFLEFEFDVFDEFVPDFGGVGGNGGVGDDVVLIEEEAFFGDLDFVAVGSEGVGVKADGVEGPEFVPLGEDFDGVGVGV